MKKGLTLNDLRNTPKRRFPEVFDYRMPDHINNWHNFNIIENIEGTEGVKLYWCTDKENKHNWFLLATNYELAEDYYAETNDIEYLDDIINAVPICTIPKYLINRYSLSDYNNTDNMGEYPDVDLLSDLGILFFENKDDEYYPNRFVYKYGDSNIFIEGIEMSEYTRQCDNVYVNDYKKWLSEHK